MIKLSKVKEGDISLYRYTDSEGKVSTELPVFYNPDKSEDRDICIALIKELKPQKALDLLAASGVRGIRLAKLGIETTINDWNDKAHKLIIRNVKLNKVNAIIRNENANQLLTEGDIYDYIDIDPYGSPLQFVDNSLRALKNKGYLGVCATDTGALAGSFPKVSKRRYGSKSFKTVFYAESGIRILAKKIIEMGAQYDYAMTPIYAHLTIQGYRIYFKKQKGAKRADKLLSQIEMVQYCKTHGCTTCKCKDKIEYGPLFTGKIWNEDLAKKIRSVSKATEYIASEASYPAFHYDLSKLSSFMKRDEPKFEPFLEKVKGARSHFTAKGFRTTAKLNDILKIIKKS